MVKVLQLNMGGGWWWKVEEVVRYAERHGITVVVVCETWLCTAECEDTSRHYCHVDVEVEGWRWVGRERRTRGGGVGFLVHDSVCFRPRPDLTSPAELMWIELETEGSSRSVLMGSAYITGGDLDSMKHLCISVDQLSERFSRMVLCGDFNARLPADDVPADA